MYQVLQVSHCQHQCHYCYLSAASRINKPVEAYSKVNSMLFNHLSNYHYLLTKKTTLVFSVHAVTLPGTLAMAHYLLQRLHVHFQTSFSFTGTKGWTSEEVAQSFHLTGSIVSF